MQHVVFGLTQKNNQLGVIPAVSNVCGTISEKGLPRRKREEHCFQEHKTADDITRGERQRIKQKREAAENKGGRLLCW
ncbi:hypothetical protein chiPu_0006886 [Chiloscyllium punctatum]|uniref:Uncharacterized protein n=1 Tax=Chiloscyllium punctatum TaxID=137246 RepID=A0A401SDH6_CHIPU|nr:hypothetical protein [Chiloscyllium punctatum]